MGSKTPYVWHLAHPTSGNIKHVFQHAVCLGLHSDVYESAIIAHSREEHLGDATRLRQEKQLIMKHCVGSWMK